MVLASCRTKGKNSISSGARSKSAPKVTFSDSVQLDSLELDSLEPVQEDVDEVSLYAKNFP